MRARWPFLAALVVVVVCDLWSKYAAFDLDLNQVTHPQVKWVLGEWLGLTKTLNPGAVWGIGKEYTGILIGVRLLVLVGVVVYLFTLRRPRPLPVIALGLISGGAIGNLYDNFTVRPGGFTWDLAELFRYPGKVRDFIHVDLGFPPCNPWPDFNVADSMILVGVGMLILFLPCAEKCAPAKSAKGSGNGVSTVEESPPEP